MGVWYSCSWLHRRLGGPAVTSAGPDTDSMNRILPKKVGSMERRRFVEPIAVIVSDLMKILRIASRHRMHGRIMAKNAQLATKSVAAKSIMGMQQPQKRMHQRRRADWMTRKALLWSCRLYCANCLTSLQASGFRTFEFLTFS